MARDPTAKTRVEIMCLSLIVGWSLEDITMILLESLVAYIARDLEDDEPICLERELNLI